MEKLFVVQLRAFGKHIIEKIEAVDREEAKQKVCDKYGIEITSRPAS